MGYGNKKLIFPTNTLFVKANHVAIATNIVVAWVYSIVLMQYLSVLIVIGLYCKQERNFSFSRER